MSTVATQLPDELVTQLKTVAAALKVSEDELIALSLEAYLAQLQSMSEFQPIAFGIWKDRDEMKDSVAWVKRLRETEWCR